MPLFAFVLMQEKDSVSSRASRSRLGTLSGSRRRKVAWNDTAHGPPSDGSCRTRVGGWGGLAAEVGGGELKVMKYAP